MRTVKPIPITSWFRIFMLPGGEKLMLTPSNDTSRPQTGAHDIHAFGNIVMQLSECDANYQVPNYRYALRCTLNVHCRNSNAQGVIDHCLYLFWFQTRRK